MERIGVICGEVEHGGDLQHAISTLRKHGARDIAVKRFDECCETAVFTFNIEGDRETFIRQVSDDTDGIVVDTWVRCRAS